jgi:hypothetical protein
MPANYCVNAVYESPSAEAWVRCSRKKAKQFAYGVMIVSVIVFMLVIGSGADMPTVLVTGLILGGIRLGTMYMVSKAGPTAQREWGVLQQRNKTYEVSGMSAAEATVAVQREDLEREKIELMREQASATRSQAYGTWAAILARNT